MKRGKESDLLWRACSHSAVYSMLALLLKLLFPDFYFDWSGNETDTSRENCLKMFKICQKCNMKLHVRLVGFSLISLNDITLLREIFMSHSFCNFEVRIFNDTSILHFYKRVTFWIAKLTSGFQVRWHTNYFLCNVTPFKFA